mmetsp:Transcript_42124/g.136341  ORF Transcript_42124/g.136341 Transcript_42124/m.136341 type:complete len:346 (-) Transcript_42124:67-1104(-)
MAALWLAKCWPEGSHAWLTEDAVATDRHSLLHLHRCGRRGRRCALLRRRQRHGLRGKLLALDEPARPEILRQERVGDILVRHVEVALVAPGLAPRVANDEPLLVVVVADGHHRVAAELGLEPSRHPHDACVLHLLRHEGLVHRKAKHKGKVFPDAQLHVVQGLIHLGVLRAPVQHALLVGLLGRGCRELRLVVGPSGLGADALLLQDLHAIADHGPRILVHGALHVALVVVDEEAAGNEVLQPFLDLVEVEGGPDGVGGAAAEVALVVEREALLGAEVLRPGKIQVVLRSPREGSVPEVGEVRLPAQPLVRAHLGRKTGLGHREHDLHSLVHLRLAVGARVSHGF